MGHLDGRVALVTGAGRGIGRGEALALAGQGARVVVNDLGGAWDGKGADQGPAAEVVDEIKSRGGQAIANADDVTDPDGAARMVAAAVDAFGRLDILVNNAGILRDGMVFSIDPQDWSKVINMHLMGHFLPTRAAAQYWRAESKQGNTSHRAIINTTSESGLFGNAGQSNYDAAKMGIVSFTVAVARETAKYGVTVNAIAPRARTRLTTTTFENSGRAGEFATEERPFDAMDPENIAPFVAFLATDMAADITAQTFIVCGGAVAHVKLPQVSDIAFKQGRWTVDELGERREELFKNLGPDVYEGPRGYARLPKQ
ncbi:SDR family NAD(P)-dependent oxidoreductase [Mycobacterium sp. CVI_P3]|uniref:SDR family NAD(P)-dependent oxidoreductase n=1 Tax=Mycobacterium pinniadriaticum TaxID=2994102 RepID=A0ABT3SC59_9MYCO|nr:SDR family NAD(P)-dependent oxidoreductase [Mycobacterium pinniadriaticum]MCX2929879.1 SDR family NAD(P)-dependent oxidoreductase [Mycobacterium pinniadriaticum]MCX2936472.1 SDR family NAD(P)-dependent oxidoreductase [Mycobacterium pinniadriaticum]